MGHRMGERTSHERGIKLPTTHVFIIPLSATDAVNFPLIKVFLGLLEREESRLQGGIFKQMPRRNF